MFAQLIFTLLGLTTSASAQSEVDNLTLTNEFYGRGGYTYWLYNPGGVYSNIIYYGISGYDFAYDEGVSSVSQGIYEGCNGLCASSFPFGVAFNVSQPLHSANLTADEYVPYGFSLYSFNYGCVANGPDALDVNGTKTFGPVPRDCTISATGKTTKGKTVSHKFHFKPEGIPSNLTFGTFPASFHNLTHVVLNATYKASKRYPYAPVVAFDDVVFSV